MLLSAGINDSVRVFRQPDFEWGGCASNCGCRDGFVDLSLIVLTTSIQGGVGKAGRRMRRFGFGIHAILRSGAEQERRWRMLQALMTAGAGDGKVIAGIGSGGIPNFAGSSLDCRAGAGNSCWGHP